MATTTQYEHENLNFWGRLKRLGLQVGSSAAFATVGIAIIAGNASAETGQALAPVLALAIGSAVLGFVTYKAIPMKIIKITIAAQTRVRVQ